MPPVRPLSAVLTVLLTASVLAPAAAQPGPQWQREFEAASGLVNACTAQSRIDACERRVAHLRKAMDAPDADAATRHGLFSEWMGAERDLGEELLKTGQVESATTVLAQAYQEVVKHADGGSHSHAWIDNIRLMSTFIEALLQDDAAESAENVAYNVRGYADQYYGARNSRQDQAWQLRVQGAAVHSIDFETRYAAALVAYGTKKSGAEARSVLASAQQAYDRAITWVERTIELDAQLTGDPPRIRIFAIQNLKAAAILAFGNTRQAADAYRTTYAAGGCSSQFGKVSALECQRALRGYVSAGGSERDLDTR